MKRGPCAVLVSVLALSGCQAARIEAPARPVDERFANACYRVLTVRFHHQFKPGTFEAYLDGQNITGLFALPHSPGGTTNAVMTGPFTGGDLQAGVFKHKLDTKGSCAFPGCGGDLVEFIPIHLRPKISSQNFRRGTVVNGEVQVSPVSAVALQVEVKPTNNNVALYDVITGWHGPGQSIVLTIPASTLTGSFAVRGETPGSYTLQLLSPGCQIGEYSGKVLD